jgi:hypothetical protein
MTGIENASTNIHSVKFKGVIPKIVFINGTYKINMCDKTEPKMATINHRLIQGGMTNKELSSLRALRALSISIMTSTERLSVLAFIFPFVKYSHGFFEKSNPSKLFG